MSYSQSVTAGAGVREAPDATSAATTPAVTPPTESAPPTPGPGQLDIYGHEHGTPDPEWREAFDIAEGVEG